MVMKLMVGVEAETAEEAKEKLFDSDLDFKVEDNKSEFEYVDFECEILEKVVQGNVYYGGINEIEVAEAEE